MIYKEFFILISELFLLINAIHVPSFMGMRRSCCVFFGFSLSSWVMGAWVIIFTIVVFGVKIGSNSLSYSNEIVNVDEVGNVCVQVVLEMLHHIKVRLDVFVSSNSWEGESTIHKFPCVDSWDSCLQFLGNFNSIQVVLFIEVS